MRSTAAMTGAPLAWRWGDPVAPLAALLARGGVLAIPTESSYGLAADPRNPAGVAAVYRVKGRDGGQAAAGGGGGARAARRLGDRSRPPYTERLSAVWPGPLSLLLPFTAVAAPLPAAAGAPAWRCGCRGMRASRAARGAGDGSHRHQRQPQRRRAGARSQGSWRSCWRGRRRWWWTTAGCPGAALDARRDVGGGRAGGLAAGSFPAARLRALWDGP